MASRANKRAPRASNRIEGERGRKSKCDMPTGDEMAAEAMMPHHAEDEAEKDAVRYDGGVPAGSKAADGLKVMEAWARQVSAQVVNPDGPAGGRTTPLGGLAMGQEQGARRFAESGAVLDLHTVTPSDAAVVQWSNGQNHRVDSALEQHTDGSARLQVLDQAGVATPHLREQFGNRAPMGAAGAARSMPTGTASDRPGMQAGPAPRPMVAADTRMTHLDATMMPFGNRQMPRGGHNPYGSQQAPGSQFTSRAPGE